MLASHDSETYICHVFHGIRFKVNKDWASAEALFLCATLPHTATENDDGMSRKARIPRGEARPYGPLRLRRDEKASETDRHIAAIVLRCLSFCCVFRCRGDRIRTCDHLVPNQARYRTALRPAAIRAPCAMPRAAFGAPSSYDALFHEYLFEDLHAALHLLFGVRGHESEAHERVLRSASGRYHRVDKHAVVVG